MTLSERLELVRAGFSRDEIVSFEQTTESDPQHKSEPDPQHKPEPDPQHKPEPDPQHKPEPDPQSNNSNTEVLAAINALTRAIQSSNMQKIGLDTNSAMTAEQALASGVFGNK